MRNFSWLSIISCLISVLGWALSVAIFSNPSLIPLFVLVGLTSIVIPLISKKIRLDAEKKGKFFEIIAIILGGLNFYFIIYALTDVNIYIGYLGWIFCGIIYKKIK